MKRATLALVVCAVLGGSVVAGWALAPLFLDPRAEVPAPAGFTDLLAEGTWRGVDDFHFASGAAKILGNGEGEYVLRLEDFRVRNGPDIHFFLSADAAYTPGDVDLGRVPATSGNYNVPIPAGASPSDAGFVLVHCVPANVLFATADLS